MPWTCQRQQGGERCRHVNENRKRNCVACGKPRPKRQRPAHMAALDLPYEHYVRINGGEWCGICGCEPTLGRRLDRDHCHKTGQPRGLLCHRCNRTLPEWVTIDWLLAAIKYLRRAKRASA
ncbi:MAG: endonuclease domain-containing protein [Solirubrobacteraceae bacterium]